MKYTNILTRKLKRGVVFIVILSASIVVISTFVPGGFVPACEKGFIEGLNKGPLVGAEVINVQVELYDGSYHDVDSSEVAFKIAGVRSLHEAIEKSSAALQIHGGTARWRQGAKSRWRNIRLKRR